MLRNYRKSRRTRYLANLKMSSERSVCHLVLSNRTTQSEYETDSSHQGTFEDLRTSMLKTLVTIRILDLGREDPAPRQLKLKTCRSCSFRFARVAPSHSRHDLTRMWGKVWGPRHLPTDLGSNGNRRRALPGEPGSRPFETQRVGPHARMQESGGGRKAASTTFSTCRV